MDLFDPIAVQYRKQGKVRRKRQNPSYKGPERRLEKRREMVIISIIRKLEKEVAD